MGRATADLLAKCLEDIRAGRLTVGGCLSAHPGEAKSLRPLLETALRILPPPSVGLDPHFRLRGRVALVEAIHADQQAAARSPLMRLRGLVARDRGQPRHPAFGRMRVPAMVVSILLVLTAALGGGATYASQSSLPGDALYPVKLGVESLQVSLATDEDGKTRAYTACADVRLEEAQRAIALGRAEAARSAAVRYSSCVADAEDHLTIAAKSDKNAARLAGWLSRKVDRHRATLADVKRGTPEPAWSSLDRAEADAGRVYSTATTVAQGTGPESLAPDVPPATAPASPPDRPTQGPGPGPNGGPGKPEPITIPSSVAPAIAQMITEAERLAANPQAAGQSFRGLRAKLEAAQESLVRGRGDAVIHELDLFLNELNAMLRSGHISIGDYDNLYGRYSDVINKLGGTPGAKIVPAPQGTPPAPTAGPEKRDRSGPQSGDQPPEGDRGRSGPDGGPQNRDGPGARPAVPPEADRGRGEPDSGPKDKGSPGGRPSDTPKQRGGPGSGPDQNPDQDGNQEGGPDGDREPRAPLLIPEPVETPEPSRSGPDGPGADTPRQETAPSTAEPPPASTPDSSGPGSGAPDGGKDPDLETVQAPSPPAPQAEPVPADQSGGPEPAPDLDGNRDTDRVVNQDGDADRERDGDQKGDLDRGQDGGQGLALDQVQDGLQGLTLDRVQDGDRDVNQDPRAPVATLGLVEPPEPSRSGPGSPVRGDTPQEEPASSIPPNQPPPPSTADSSGPVSGTSAEGRDGESEAGQAPSTTENPVDVDESRYGRQEGGRRRGSGENWQIPLFFFPVL